MKTLFGVVTALVCALGMCQDPPPGGGVPVQPSMKVIITGENHFVSPIKFNASVRNVFLPPDLTESPPVGQYVATFTASLSLISKPDGWEMLSVHWPDNFDWVELSWDMLGWYAPINGTLICQNATGLSTPAYAFRWAGIASTFCITKWKRPDETTVNITVGIVPGESVLSVAGPLQCGVTQGQVPPLPNDDNDDKNPWYLDYFGVPPTLGQYPAIAQHPQFGTSQPMFPQSTEIPSFYLWRFDESGAQGVILWPGTPQNQQSNIKLAAIGNTGSGAIKPRCEFTGTFRGHSYSYDDEQDYRILQSDWTWAVRPHLLTFTGHQPGTVEIVGDPLIDSNATMGDPPIPNPDRTHCWYHYQMKLVDVAGRPMHGAWVQEKFTPRHRTSGPPTWSFAPTPKARYGLL